MQFNFGVCHVFRYTLTALVAYFKDDFTRVAANERPLRGVANEMRKILVAQILFASDPVSAVSAPSLFSLKSIGVRVDNARQSGKVGSALPVHVVFFYMVLVDGRVALCIPSCHHTHAASSTMTYDTHAVATVLNTHCLDAYHACMIHVTHPNPTPNPQP